VAGYGLVVGHPYEDRQDITHIGGKDLPILFTCLTSPALFSPGVIGTPL
jgi:hypothetical protein